MIDGGKSHGGEEAGEVEEEGGAKNLSDALSVSQAWWWW